MKKILVMGATGLLGSSIVPKLIKSGNNLITQSLKKESHYILDITNYSKAFDLINSTKPDIIINMVALTSVEDCQNNINQAYLLNCKTLENTVRAIANINHKMHLIHISTDHVYDGPGPHKEENISIKNNYAFSKYAGELIASNVNSTIIRTNFVGKSESPGRESMTDWIYYNLKLNKKINVFSDVQFNPLSMNTLCEVLEKIIIDKPRGTFNLGSRNGMSKADFDFLFAEKCHLDISNMSRISVEKVDWDMAYRPKDMRMDVEKIENRLSIKLPELVDEIEYIAKQYI